MQAQQAGIGLAEGALAERIFVERTQDEMHAQEAGIGEAEGVGCLHLQRMPRLC